MSSRLSQKQKVLAAVAIIVAIFILAGCYLLVLQPKQAELERKEAELKTEEALLAQVQSQLQQKSTKMYESTVALQKQIPVKPLLERFVLDIEKAEVLSGSIVERINIGGSDTIEAEKGASEADSEPVTEEEEQATAVENISLPDGFQKVSINLHVKAPGYYELEEFINILERTDRIITVESVSFPGNNEIVSIHQADDEEVLNLQMTVSAYYMPQLIELINQLPRIDAPEPGNKTNPLFTFPED